MKINLRKIQMILVLENCLWKNKFWHILRTLHNLFGVCTILTPQSRNSITRLKLMCAIIYVQYLAGKLQDNEVLKTKHCMNIKALERLLCRLDITKQSLEFWVRSLHEIPKTVLNVWSLSGTLPFLTHSLCGYGSGLKAGSR